ncbi:MAG: signal peptidase II [Verrucomicrobia bacterium]|nr:signal peptidase II [Verrucomicrobiota bacterium]
MNVLAITAAMVLLLDQATKWLVLKFQPHDVPVIGNFFHLTLVTNRGAAWGLFSRFDHSNALLTAFSILTIIALWVFRRSLAATRFSQKLAIGLIVGGIFGNLVDRILRGCVVDFLDFYLGAFYARLTGGTGHWPAFNVADSAICVGVALYLILMLRHPHHADAEPVPHNSLARTLTDVTRPRQKQPPPP